MRIQVERKNILACANCVRGGLRLAKFRASGRCAQLLQTCRNGTRYKNKKAKVMYISKREEKRRLQKLWHMSAEEQMQEYYLQQEKRAFKLGTSIERNAFEIGKGTKQPKKAKNKFSKEEFGTCGSTISVRKFAVSQEFVEKRGTSVRRYTLTSYTNIVCKSYSNKY